MKKVLVLSIFFMICISWQEMPANNKTILNATPHHILEIVIFTSKPNITNKQILKRAKDISSILKSYPGFISRTFAQDTHNKSQWLDQIQWLSLRDANAAANNIVNTKQMKLFMSIMQSYHMYHFQMTLNITK